MMAVAVEPQTVVIALLLVGVFVVAYKILKMLLETAFVTFISAAFYFTMAIVLDMPTNLDRILTFAFLGATLYMIFTVVASTFKGASKVFGFIGKLLDPFVSAIVPDKSREKKRLKKMEKKLKKYEKKLKNVKKSQKRSRDDKDDEGGTVKEVVLRNNDDED